MKNPFDILRIKEQELLKVKRQTDALRTTARLLLLQRENVVLTATRLCHPLAIK